MRILVVDDQRNIRRTMATALESMDHEVAMAETGGEAMQELRKASYQVVFLDLKLQQENGLDVLGEILGVAPNAAVVILTAYASVDTAVEAMRRGAFDYLPKPCTPDQVRQLLARISHMRQLESRVVELESRMSAEFPEVELHSDSPLMQQALNIAAKAAGSEATVLITGESGTGKSVLARAMHAHSPRAAAPFITVSCPSLSRELLESELFGHVKGSFTGAYADTIGKVAAAEGGTLFLDEIGDLPVEIQAKLLRLLQEREYERVGNPRPQRANVRVIAATNREISRAVAEGRFREDLYYRLNVINIAIPPLRDRTIDLRHVTERLLEFFASRSGKRIEGFSDEAMRAMQAYRWPGNLRELRNVIERAVILGTGNRIELADLADLAQPKDDSKGDFRIGGHATLAQVENEHIRRVLANSRTIDEAAQVLGIDPATLYRRKKKL